MLIPLVAACVATLPEDTDGTDVLVDTDAVDTDDTDTIPNDDDDDDLGLCAIALDCPGKITATKRVCTISIADVAGEPEWQGDAEVWLRGRSSATSPKPQYAIELHDADGEDASVDLLSMGADPDWVLHGLYFDRLLVRNSLGYDLFQAFSPDGYAPESRFCELTLDGKARGVYGLIEKIKRDDDRVALTDSDAAFVVKLSEDEQDWPNPAGYGGWKLVSPNDPPPDAMDAIGDALDRWEQAALAGDVSDETGVFAWVDLDSAVDFVILHEVLKNHDAYFLSVHASKDVDQKIRLIPWDLDLSLGEPTYNDNPNPNSWLQYRPKLFDVMSDSPAFQARLAARWEELRGGELAEEAIFARIDAQQATMGDAIERNFDVWPIADIDFYGYLDPVSSYAEEDANVRAFLSARLDWMDTSITTW